MVYLQQSAMVINQWNSICKYIYIVAQTSVATSCYSKPLMEGDWGTLCEGVLFAQVMHVSLLLKATFAAQKTVCASAPPMLPADAA